MEKQLKNILFYGFGRMGLTHLAILQGLKSDLHFSVLETNKKMVAILRKNFPNVSFYTDESKLPNEPFDLTLITTPPFIHKQLLSKVKERGDKRVFIEKPFGGHLNNSSDRVFDNVFIGYVLRFNPCVQWVKENILPKDIIKAKGQYLSHTLDKKPKGWRNGEYSGVLNEMGSHIIDLLNYIVGLDGYKVIKASKKSVVSDVDDIVDATLKVDDREIELYLNWVNKDIRKPVFGLELELKNGQHVFIDQQIIRITQEGEIIKQISVTDLGATVPFYLRGVDFTKQMEDLIGSTNTMCTMGEALKVNLIIKDILNS
jgi:predicted dehydrogenase